MKTSYVALFKLNNHIKQNQTELNIGTERTSFKCETLKNCFNVNLFHTLKIRKFF